MTIYFSYKQPRTPAPPSPPTHYNQHPRNQLIYSRLHFNSHSCYRRHQRQPMASGPASPAKPHFLHDKTARTNHPQPLLLHSLQKGLSKEGSYQHFDKKTTHNPHQISISGRQNCPR
jgi:hypothetical protein